MLSTARHRLKAFEDKPARKVLSSVSNEQEETLEVREIHNYMFAVLRNWMTRGNIHAVFCLKHKNTR